MSPYLYSNSHVAAARALLQMANALTHPDTEYETRTTVAIVAMRPELR